MRIVSNFRDYYDGCQTAESDFNYIRHTKVESKDPRNDGLRFSHCGHSIFRPVDNDATFYLRSHVVGFCGKSYGILQFKYGREYCAAHSVGTKYGSSKSCGLTTCVSIEDVDKFTEKFTDDERELFHRKSRWSNRNRQAFEKFFERASNTEVDDIFIKYRCPSFVSTAPDYGEKEFLINPMLQEYEFFRLFDAQMAYQEISMFLGNMASPEKEIPQPDDKTMAEIKGFDKYSFRKDPSKKKLKS